MLMSFIWPALLWSLLTIPLLVLLYLRMQERREQFALRYGSLGLVRQAAGRGVGSRRHVPAMLFLGGLCLLLLAMARPQMPVSLPKAEGTVILAFDVSGSMSANDFEPTRMEAAKAVAKEFVERQPTSVQIGIVAFSEGGFSVQIPTNDQAAIIAAIDRLQPQRGTSLANGILVSLNAIANANGDAPIMGTSELEASPPATFVPVPAGSEHSAVIVLLTDGENNMEPDPFTAAQAAADRGVRIHTIGIGSASGTELDVNGFTVFTHLDEVTLQRISATTDGLYYNAQTEEDLKTIYENIEPRLKLEREETEVTAIFAGLSILILLVGGMLSLFWFSHVP
jgi:Ca-activated chloride channel family protein